MSNPIRILQVFALMNRGGAETMIMNLYRNIDRSKVQFDFIVHTNDECSYDKEIKKLGGTIYRIPAYKGKNHFSYTKLWHEFFKEHPEYKIIHGHVRSTAAIYLGISKMYGLSTIAHSHSTSSGNGFSSFVKNVLQYPIRYIADYLFACSKSAGVWLYGIKSCMKENFHILNNAVDVTKFFFNEEIRKEKRKEFKIEDKFVFGHIGRFHEPKNHEFLIDIFNEIYIKNNNVVLLLVGDGELRKLIEKKVDSLGLTESVIFTGVRSDISDILQAMDIFIFPSLYEGLPVTLIEAQAAGIPCLISDEITKEVDMGLDLMKFLELASIDSWVTELENLIVEKRERDPSKLKMLKDRGYDIKNTAKWLENFYITNSR